MIRLKKNQLAMFHPQTLSDRAIDWIIRNCDAVKLVNDLSKRVKSYTKDDYLNYKFIREEVVLLNELEQRIDIWEKKEV